MRALENKTEEKLTLKKKLLFFFFPPKCALCGRVGWEELCPSCREEMDEAFSPRKFLAAGGNGFADEMIALFDYESETVKPLLFQWKREDYEDLREIFTSFATRAAGKKLLPAKVDYITFAPRRPSARLKNGFDQAESFARALSEKFGIPFQNMLGRRPFSKAQHKLHGNKRDQNVQDAFYPLGTLEGETVLLVDDIVTTGASVKECARILKKCGAMKVYVLCIAH